MTLKKNWKTHPVSKLVYTICRKCGKTSNALFSRICDECFNKETNFKKIRISSDSLHCLRCNHVWVPRHPKVKPKVCPKCHNAYWDVPRKKKKLQCPKKAKVQRKQYPKRKTYLGRPQPDIRLLNCPQTRAQYFKEKYG